MVRTGRPKKERSGTTRSFYLTPESEDVLNRYGVRSNLSEFINSLILNSAEDSPVYVGIQIERLSKEVSDLEEHLLSKRTELRMLQARLNLMEKKLTDTDNTHREGRLELLRLWDRCVQATRDKPARADGQFLDALGGPSNIGLVRSGGFITPDESLAWCKAESRRR